MGFARFALLNALVIAALYGRALGYPFVYDDRVLIEGSARLADLSTLPGALVRDLFYIAGDVRPSPYWRPVVTLSYYLDWRTGDGQPWSFHLTNLVALWAATLGLFAVLRERGPAAAPMALLFAVWPTQVEGACNVAGRTDVLCAAFFAAALWVRSPLAAAGLAALACGSKEVGVLLPLVSWLLGRREAARAQLLAVGAYLAGRAWVLSQAALSPEDQVGPTLVSVAGAGARMSFWLMRLALPLPLSPAMELPPSSLAAQAGGWAAVGLLAGLVWRVRSPARWAGLALLLGALAPVSGLVTPNLRVGDTLLALPLIGAFLLLIERLGARAGAALALTAALASAPRVSDWSSERTLWERAHARLPGDPTIRLNLARTVRPEDPARALALLEGLDGEGRRGREIAATRGGALLQLGREDEGLAELSRAASPDDPEASWQNAVVCALGVARGMSGLLPLCRAASAALPEDAAVWNAHGVAAMGAGEGAEGLAAFERAAALDPGSSTYRANRDRARAELGQGLPEPR